MKRRWSKADIARMQAGKLPLPTEDDTQAIIVDGLRARGFLVLVTSRRRRRCDYCHKVSHRGDGADKGVPDLLVRLPTWSAGQWIGFEVKREGKITYSSTEQENLAKSGHIVVVQSLEEAFAAVGFRS